ncbi:hypothetical protein H920_08868 [Fukomys damarensis]|uniref:Uncharacterized protein n=1 Tax=Fukomys damarensis TaxID=885580 RepID=A0A091DGY5_FUKDA|nr:hypothetical protein H920_08868 [Fukomys damarensis]
MAPLALEKAMYSHDNKKIQKASHPRITNELYHNGPGLIWSISKKAKHLVLVNLFLRLVELEFKEDGCPFGQLIHVLLELDVHDEMNTPVFLS